MANHLYRIAFERPDENEGGTETTIILKREESYLDAQKTAAKELKRWNSMLCGYPAWSLAGVEFVDEDRLNRHEAVCIY